MSEYATEQRVLDFMGRVALVQFDGVTIYQLGAERPPVWIPRAFIAEIAKELAREVPA